PCAEHGGASGRFQAGAFRQEPEDSGWTGAKPPTTTGPPGRLQLDTAANARCRGVPQQVIASRIVMQSGFDGFNLLLRRTVRRVKLQNRAKLSQCLVGLFLSGQDCSQIQMSRSKVRTIMNRLCKFALRSLTFPVGRQFNSQHVMRLPKVWFGFK